MMTVKDYMIGARAAHEWLAGIGWQHDASSFGQTCHAIDRAGAVAQSLKVPNSARNGFLHALGLDIEA